MIYGGLAMFGLTCLWIIYKRILRGPLGLIIWVAIKVFGTGASVSSIGKVMSTNNAGKPIIAPSPTKIVETKDSLIDTGFEALQTDEALWSEGFEPDVVTEIVTVTIEQTA